MRRRSSDQHERSTIRIVRDIADDTATLVRQEVQLARQEVMDALAARLRAAAAFGVAGLMGVIVLVFLALAAEAGLQNVMTPWGARLVVAGGGLLLALMALGFAMMRVKRPPFKPEETVRTVKEDVAWAKAQLKR